MIKQTALAATGALALACGACAAPANDPSCPVHVSSQFDATAMHHPVVTSVFWGSWSSEMTSAYTDAMSRVAQGDHYLRVAEYGIDGITADPLPHDIDVSLPFVIDDGMLRNELLAEVSDGRLPAPLVDQLYMVYLPRDVVTKYMVSGDASGYHMWAETSDRKRFAYAVIEWESTFEDGMRVATHEVWEAATDPDTSTGFRADLVGPEVADLCDKAGTVPLEGGGVISKAWSQQSCGCL